MGTNSSVQIILVSMWEDSLTVKKKVLEIDVV